MLEISLILKGFFIGASMLVPGVSGGTMAMILGIYDRLVSSISSFFKHKKESFFFLLQFVLGAGAAFLLLSGFMAALTERFPEQTAFFVLGAILGGIPVIWKASTIRRPSVSNFLWLAAGILMVVALSFLPKNLFDGGEASLLGFMIQFIAGILGALALVLPGISFSSMLYMMGVYNFIFSSIGDRNFVVLLPFAAGGVVGVLLLTKFLEKAMNDFPQPTYMVILGFVLASMWDIWAAMPSVPTGLTLLPCLGLFVVGFIIIRLLAAREA